MFERVLDIRSCRHSTSAPRGVWTIASQEAKPKYKDIYNAVTRQKGSLTSQGCVPNFGRLNEQATIGVQSS